MSGEPRSWVRAFAPATVANITCGFDLLGFAVEGWGDTVEARATAEPGVHLREISGDRGRLPSAPSENTAGVAALALLGLLDSSKEPEGTGVELKLHKGLPLASGLGSSAASSVAAAVAVNAALGLEAGLDRLLAAAVAGERVACGTPHSDNAAPSLHGGLLLARSGVSPAITRLPVPEGLTAVLLHPQAEVATQAARAALPDSIPLATSVRQAGNLAALVAGLASGDFELISSALVDHVAEPARAGMVPGFEAVRAAALAAGAVGCGLSGSGPTIFAWSKSPAGAGAIESAMRDALRASAALEGETLISPVGARGARVLSGPAPRDDGASSEAGAPAA